MITNFDELLCNAEQILSKRSLSPVTVDQYLAGMRQIFKIARALGHQSCSHEFFAHSRINAPGNPKLMHQRSLESFLFLC